jgi:hypothetical protein
MSYESNEYEHASNANDASGADLPLDDFLNYEQYDVSGFVQGQQSYLEDNTTLAQTESSFSA